MKQSPEITRFLNHIEREKNKTSHELSKKIFLEHEAMKIEQSAKIAAERELETMRAKNVALESEISMVKIQANYMLAAARILLPKIRINIYANSDKTTPRFFKSGKWWPRETGGFDPDFVAEMTAYEIQEAINFYGTTEIPLMLPKSHRAETAEKI